MRKITATTRNLCPVCGGAKRCWWGPSTSGNNILTCFGSSSEGHPDAIPGKGGGVCTIFALDAAGNVVTAEARAAAQRAWSKENRTAGPAHRPAPVNVTVTATAEDLDAQIDDALALEIAADGLPTRLDTERAPAEVLDTAYRSLLDACPLSDQHRQALEARGFGADAIERGGYASLPRPGSAQARRAARAAVEAVGQLAAAGVPGLILTDAGGRGWDLAGHSGLLVPMRRRDGMIYSLKLRDDYAGIDGVKRKEIDGGKNKYKLLSSAAFCGPSAEAGLHWPAGLQTVAGGTVIVTEGELKADLSAELSGRPVVSVSGVSGWGKALAGAMEIEAREVLVAYDSDCQQNAAVAAARAAFLAGLADAGYEAGILEWENYSEFKGLDDALAAGCTLIETRGEDLQHDDADDLGEAEAEEGGPEPLVAGLLKARIAIPGSIPLNIACEGYSLGKGGVFFGDSSNICPAPVLPVGSVKNVQSGVEMLDVAFMRADGRWDTLTRRKREFADRNKLIELSNFGLPVHSNNAGGLAEYLVLATHANEHLLRQRYSSSVLGFCIHPRNGEQAYLTGKQVVDANGIAEASVDAMWQYDAGEDEEGEAMVRKAVAKKGDINAWRRLIGDVFDLRAEDGGPLYPRAYLAFYAVAAAPLMKMLGREGFILDFSGRSSTGKSVATKAAMSMVGTPGGKLLPDWNSTWVALEAALTRAQGWPVAFDDTKKLGDVERRNVDRVAYMVSGAGRARGKPGGTRVTGETCTVLQSSGEYPLNNLYAAESGGARMRTLCVRYPMGSIQAPELGRRNDKLVEDLQSHCGHAFPLYVEHLFNLAKNAGGMEGLREQLSERVREEADRLSGLAATEGLAEGHRLAVYGAILAVAAELLHAVTIEDENGSQVPLLPFDLQRDGAGRPMVWSPNDWRETVSYARDASGETASIADVFSWCNQNAHRFYGRVSADGRDARFNDVRELDKSEFYGSWTGDEDWKEIGILPNVLSSNLEKMGYNPKAIIGHWKDRGFIRLEGARETVKMTLRGDRVRMYAITRKAFEAAGAVDGQAAPVYHEAEEIIRDAATGAPF